MRNRISAIAIGSNSTRGLSALAVPGLLDPLRLREETRLFSSLTAEGVFPREAIDRTVLAVEGMKRRFDEECSPLIALMATSATRDAKNASELKERLYRATGLSLQVISGEQEARYSFIGATGMQEQRCGIIDIGGGSTEIVVGTEKQTEFSVSLQMGASRLAEKQRIDTVDDIEKAEALVTEILEDIGVPRCSRWFLVGGTGTTLVHMLLSIPHSLPLKNDAGVVLSQAEEMLQRVAGCLPEKRAEIPFLPASRIDIFPTGLLILCEVLRHIGQNSVTVTQRGNLDGVLLSHIISES